MTNPEFHTETIKAPKHKEAKDKSLAKEMSKSIIKPQNIEQIKKSIFLDANKLIKRYDDLSLNKLSYEEKIIFSNHLLSLYQKAKKVMNSDVLHTDVDSTSLMTAIEMMKSSDIHDKVIGIDLIFSLTHQGSHFLYDILCNSNGLDFVNAYLNATRQTVDIKDIREIDKVLNEIFLNKLEEIRNRRGFIKLKYSKGEISENMEKQQKILSKEQRERISELTKDLDSKMESRWMKF